jgi:hypothetical protein
MAELTDHERALLEMMADRPMLLSIYSQWMDRALLEQLVKRRWANTAYSPHGTIYRVTRAGLKVLAGGKQ